MPELVRQALGDPKACVRTVHRLDRVVSGLMVLARTPAAASKLSAQIREHDFGKTYLAVVHGAPSPLQGTYRDLLRRDPNERKTYVTDRMAKGVQEAVLDYDVLGTRAELSLVLHLSADRAHASDPLPVLVARSAALGRQEVQHPARRRADRALVALPALCPPGNRRGALLRAAAAGLLSVGPIYRIGRLKFPALPRGENFYANQRRCPIKCLANDTMSRYNVHKLPVTVRIFNAETIT